MPCICNTKITRRIHFIAPRHAFRFDLHDSKIQCALFPAFHRRAEGSPPPAREETGVNKNHVETHVPNEFITLIGTRLNNLQLARP